MQASERIVALDLGGTKLAAGLVEGDLTVVESRRLDVRTLSFLDRLDLVEQVAVELSSRPGVKAIGVSVAGAVDQPSGDVAYREVMPGDRAHVGTGPLRVLSLSERLRQATGRPVSVVNDGSAAAFAEWIEGVGRGIPDFVCLTIGTHIGSGVIAHGELVSCRWSGPMVGGIVGLDDRGSVIVGDRCSGTGIAALALELCAPDSPLRGCDAVQIFERARAGDREAMTVVAEAGRWLGVLIAGAFNVFAAEVVALGGGVMAGWDLLRPSAQAVYDAPTTLPNLAGPPRVELARFGSEASLIGAALMARQLAGS